jgi:hypothetical protein
MDSIVELNQIFRTSIEQHDNYLVMYGILSAQTKNIVNALLADDVTPELIRTAHLATPEEFSRYTFLRVLDGGNPSPAATVQLTNIVLEYLLAGLDDFWEYEEDEDL